MQQSRFDLLELTADTIVRKIKAFVNDPDVVGLTLLVQRKKGPKVAATTRLIEKPQPSEPRMQGKPEQDEIETIALPEQKTTFHQDQIGRYDFLRDTRMQKAKKHYTQGNYDTAIELYEEVYGQTLLKTKMSPGEIEGDRERKLANLTFELGNCYYHKKQYEKAIAFYKNESTHENLKHRAMRKSNLGTICLQQERFQLSLKYYSEALLIYNQCEFEEIDLSNTYHNVGRIYLHEHMHKNAIEYFSKAIEERKTKSPASELPLFQSIFKLGVAQRGDKQYAESLKSFEYALSFAERGVGQLIEVLKQIAAAYENTNKWKEALGVYEKIIEDANSSADSRGYAYEKAGIIIYHWQDKLKGLEILKIAQKVYREGENTSRADYIQSCYLLDEKK